MTAYRLEGHTPVPCTILEASRILEGSKHIVQQDRIGDVSVSTVFLV